MKIDFDRVLTGLNGESIKDPRGTDIRLKDVCINALDYYGADELLKAPGQEKYHRGQLAQRIYDASGPIEISVEDVALLKSLTGKIYGPHVVMVVWDMLDSNN